MIVRLISHSIIALLFVAGSFSVASASGFETKATVAVLMDGETGDILY